MIPYQIIFLHALPLDGRMWASELERYGGRSVAPTLYSFGESLQDWSAGVLEAASDGPLIIVGCSVDTVRSIALSLDPEQLVNGLRAFHDRRDLTGFAHTWHGTIVSISGDQDRTPRASANAEWTSLPNRSAHVVEDCGHYVSLEQPERFESLLDAAISLISMRALPSA